MTKPTRVLVTAVGGDFGQAIVKALRLSGPRFEIHGTDVDPAGIGRAFVDGYAPLPLARDAGYLDALDAVCRARGIDVIVPGSEPEIALLGGHDETMRLRGGAAIVCQPGGWVSVFGDKLTCMEALAPHVPLARFADGGDRDAVDRLVADAGYPIIVKARRASGSRGVRLVRDDGALREALAEIPAPLVQAFIGEEGGEFSVGLFACETFDTAIVFRRELGPVGCSWFAETVEDPEVLDYARRVARAAGLRGAANVQVRKGPDGVRLLEINARFSSLVAARAACGFRDAEWSVDLAMGVAPRPPAPYTTLRFRRFFHELIDTGDGYAAVAAWQPKIAAGIER